MTRMWMQNPKILCRKHLLGEHNEIHKALGSLSKGRHIRNYIRNNCLEPLSMKKRHDQLSEEMRRRGFRHQSPLGEAQVDKALLHLEDWEIDFKIDRYSAFLDLIARCPDCSARSEELFFQEQETEK